MPSPPPSTLSRAQAIDLYFMEHRAKLLDVAAFLDRLDRTAGPVAGPGDFRLDAFRGAVALLLDGRPHRAKRILELFSDPTSGPIDRAGVKGATGAYPGPPQTAAH